MAAVVRAIEPNLQSIAGELASAVDSQKTLSNVLQWLAKLGASDGLIHVLTQDEYTHDVTVHFREGIYLVYDVT